jgi:hypothetical protein
MRWSARASLLIALVISGSSFLTGQDLPFSSGSDGSDGALIVPNHPNFRENAAAAYHAARDETILFGGQWSSTFYPETWRLDGDTGDWSLVQTSTFVSGRRDHAMTYDPVNEVIILFGGYRADATLMNDMWSFDGTDWTLLTPATVPTARFDHVMAARPADGAILLFGGNTGSNVNDTWFWNGTTWAQLAPTMVPDANSAYFNAMVFHEGLDGWLLYSENTGKTWLFNGTNWSQLTTATHPNTGGRPVMAYDAARNEVVLNGGDDLDAETWVFTTSNDWAQRTPATVPNRRRGNALVYDSARERVFTILGDFDSYYRFSADAWSSTWNRFTTWGWDGTDWEYESGWYYFFDLSQPDADSDGRYEFTDIVVPANVQVRFIKDASNSPVEWYASGNVTIDGWILVEGRDAPTNTGAGLFAAGGPGGGSGGVGGTRFDVSGSFAGTPGAGPGGGAPGVAENQFAQHGNFFGVYGNAALQPLQGGSGGGGGGSGPGYYGGNGGGGGGAILISASGDITVNGGINADGGRNDHTGGDGGDGSGGAIFLQADRVLGGGSLWARGGRANGIAAANGRIRIEGFFRPLAVNASPPPSATAPVESVLGDLDPSLQIVSVDGAGVVSPPSGNPNTPDVVFADSGEVVIVVQGADLPVGTEVTLRITGTGTIIELPAPGDPAVTLDAGLQATFTTTVPAGVGTLQAFAEYTP